jgi:hypothetical protein
MITPLSMTVEIPDSAQTSSEHSNASDDFTASYKLGGGGGRYYRELGFSGCSPSYPVKQEFIDVGGEVDLQRSRTTHIGLRGGYIRDTVHPVSDFGSLEDSIGVTIDRTEDVGYGNVYVSGEWRHVGIGGGVLFTSNPLHLDNPEDDPTDNDVHVYPTGHLRFGDLSRFYISGHLFEGVPLYSGGGAFFGGAGWRPIHALEVYGGFSASGPYHKEGWIGRVTADFNRSWSLQTTLRFPVQYQDYDQDEYGVSASLTYRTFRPGSD